MWCMEKTKRYTYHSRASKILSLKSRHLKNYLTIFLKSYKILWKKSCHKKVCYNNLKQSFNNQNRKQILSLYIRLLIKNVVAHISNRQAFVKNTETCAATTSCLPTERFYSLNKWKHFLAIPNIRALKAVAWKSSPKARDRKDKNLRSIIARQFASLTRVDRLAISDVLIRNFQSK